MHLILFGAPGVGKGTQSKLIGKKFSIPQVSTGDMLREAVRNMTELGKTAKDIMARGELVPDDLIIALIDERIAKPDCKEGMILDGFPRTIAQAEGLHGLMKKKKLPSFTCVEIDLPEEMIIQRLTNRKTCYKCGKDYNPLTNPVPADNICTNCGNEITSRKDDTEETIKKRLSVYYEQTAKVKHYYDERGRLYKVDGNKSVEEVNESIVNLLSTIE